MRPKEFDIDPVDVDDNGICAAQQAAEAGNLALDGDLVSGGVATLDYARQIGIASTGNLSGVDFTVTGTDADGRAQSETLAGPSNDTVETAKYFKTVTQVAVNGAVGTDVIVGTVDEIATQTIPIDRSSSLAASIGVDITGTINYTVQQTLEHVQQDGFNPQQDAAWHNITALASKTADLTGEAMIGATAIRLLVNSYSSTAELQMHVVQPSGR